MATNGSNEWHMMMKPTMALILRYLTSSVVAMTALTGCFINRSAVALKMDAINGGTQLSLVNVSEKYDSVQVKARIAWRQEDKAGKASIKQVSERNAQGKFPFYYSERIPPDSMIQYHITVSGLNGEHIGTIDG